MVWPVTALATPALVGVPAVARAVMPLNTLTVCAPKLAAAISA